MVCAGCDFYLARLTSNNIDGSPFLRLLHSSGSEVKVKGFSKLMSRTHPLLACMHARLAPRWKNKATEMRCLLGALLLLAAAGAYAEYLLQAASPEWDNIIVGGDTGSGGSGSGGSGLLELREGSGELLRGAPGTGFGGSGSGAPFINVQDYT